MGQCGTLYHLTEGNGFKGGFHVTGPLHGSFYSALLKAIGFLRHSLGYKSTGLTINLKLGKRYSHILLRVLGLSLTCASFSCTHLSTHCVTDMEIKEFDAWATFQSTPVVAFGKWGLIHVLLVVEWKVTLSSPSKLAKIHDTVKTSSKIHFKTVHRRRHGDSEATKGLLASTLG